MQLGPNFLSVEAHAVFLADALRDEEAGVNKADHQTVQEPAEEPGQDLGAVRELAGWAPACEEIKGLTNQTRRKRQQIMRQTPLTCFADLQPIAVVHLHLPHQRAHRHLLQLAAAQESSNPGEEDRAVVGGAPQRVWDHGGQALLDEEINSVTSAVLRQEGADVSLLLASPQWARPLQYPAVGTAPVFVQQLAEQGQHVEEAAWKPPRLPLQAAQVGKPLEEDNPQEVAPLQPAAHIAALLFSVQKEALHALAAVHEPHGADDRQGCRQRRESLCSTAVPAFNGIHFCVSSCGPFTTR